MSTRAGDPEGEARRAAFLHGLQEFGWTIDRDVRIDIRWSAGNSGDIRKYAAELVALAPDVILASGGSVVGPLLQATRIVPVVFTQTPDPVAAGFVASLARPGGNATGFTQIEYGTGAKWLELLKEVAPRMTRVAVLRDPAIPEGIGQFAVIQSVAPSLRVEVSPVDIREAGEIERAVAEFARSANGGLIVTSSGLANVHRPVILRLAVRHRLPAVYSNRVFVTDGGLISFGADFDRPASARSRLCRSHSQGRETGRPAGAGSDQVRAGDQPEDRQGARPRNSADTARPRRRGDRMSGGSSSRCLAARRPGGRSQRLRSRRCRWLPSLGAGPRPPFAHSHCDRALAFGHALPQYSAVERQVEIFHRTGRMRRQSWSSPLSFMLVRKERGGGADLPPMRGCDAACTQAPGSAAAVWAGRPLMWTVRIRRNRRTRARSPTTEVASTDTRRTIFPVP